MKPGAARLQPIWVMTAEAVPVTMLLLDHESRDRPRRRRSQCHSQHAAWLVEELSERRSPEPPQSSVRPRSWRTESIVGRTGATIVGTVADGQDQPRLRPVLVIHPLIIVVINP
jgi:hypothetical protein